VLLALIRLPVTHTNHPIRPLIPRLDSNKQNPSRSSGRRCVERTGETETYTTIVLFLPSPTSNPSVAFMDQLTGVLNSLRAVLRNRNDTPHVPFTSWHNNAVDAIENETIHQAKHHGGNAVRSIKIGLLIHLGCGRVCINQSEWLHQSARLTNGKNRFIPLSHRSIDVSIDPIHPMAR
jgi:hypothetical protein